MKVADIIDGNNLIADFLGINRHSLNFIESWDYLM